MADLIKIKRSDTTATPPTLSSGELAYSENSGNLFYGRISDGTPVKIGGNTDVLKLAGIEAGAQVNSVITVAGRTGNVVITTNDLADFNSNVNALISSTDLGSLADVYVPTPSNGQVLTWVASASKWEANASPTGVTMFVSLDDTPTTYSGAAGYIVKVNGTADGLVFANGVDGGTF